MKQNDLLKSDTSCSNDHPTARRRGGPGSRERGQSFIELTLILMPILLVLTVGIIEIGRLAYYQIEVSNAARAGAQYGAQILGNAPNAEGITLAAQNDAPDISAGLTVAPVETCGCPGAAPGTAGNCFAAPGCLYPVVYLTVTTTYGFTPLFNYPGISNIIPSTLTGVTTMPVQIQ